MLSGVTASALAITGTAVFRIVVSSDSMKKATATSHGSSSLTETGGGLAAGNRTSWNTVYLEIQWGSEASSLRPFQMNCIPMQSMMKAESRTTTFVPVVPIAA